MGQMSRHYQMKAHKAASAHTSGRTDGCSLCARQDRCSKRRLCLPFDPFPFDQNGPVPREVDVGWRQIADALMIAPPRMPSHSRCAILSRKHPGPRRAEPSRRLLMASEGEGAVGPPLGEMDLDEFRRAGHRIVDWIADYRAHPEC